MTSNFDTSDRNAQKGGDFVPRLAMINDIAGFGRCSTTVSLPVISVMKVQVCPVPTSVLSNHLGFPLCLFPDSVRIIKLFADSFFTLCNDVVDRLEQENSHQYKKNYEVNYCEDQINI